MKKPTIYQIKEATKETAPYFFSRQTLKFWGQTMKSFKVYKTDVPHLFLIEGAKGNAPFKTRRIFNALNNTLEYI
jgi:hypothetical protein